MITALAMTAATWGTWPDVVVDFGRELYVAWQVASGRHLYTELAYYNGPLSPYVNALWFRVFGVGLRSLVIGNLAILVAVVVMLHRLFAISTGTLGVTLACIAFLTVFALGNVIAIGNYNFVCPYSHEMTHGFALSVAVLLLIAAHLRRGGRGPLCAAGGCLGLTFLTKPEIFAGAAAGAACALLAPGGGPRTVLRRVGIVSVFALLPVAAAAVLLATIMPGAAALRAVVGAWPSVLAGDVSSTYFYRVGMGTLGAGANLGAMARAAVPYAAVLLPVYAYAVAVPPGAPRRRRFAALGLALLVVVLGAWWARPITWQDGGRPLPAAMVLLAGALGVRLWCVRRDPGARVRLSIALATVVFSLVTLGKILLNARVYQYGFVLAAPATLTAVAALTDWVPARIRREGGNGAIFQAAAVALVGVGIALHVGLTMHWVARKTHPVGAGADRFLADERGVAFEEAVETLRRRLRPDETLAAVPEGPMLNYLARRRDSVPYEDFMPVMLTMFGEDRMLAAFEAAPPDYVALVHKDTTEYGARFFGHDYGLALGGWVRAHYAEVAQFGHRPFETEEFGILLLRRVAP